MAVLIAYASKHGSTQGVAERIAEQLRGMGKKAETRSVDEVSDPESYEAFLLWVLDEGGHGVGASQPGRLSSVPGVAVQ